VKAVDHKKEEPVSAAGEAVAAGAVAAAVRVTFAVAAAVNKVAAAGVCVGAKVAVDAAVIVVVAAAVAAEHVAVPQVWVVENELGLSVVVAAVEPVDDGVVAVAGVEALLKKSIKIVKSEDVQ
jgi:hypothetical protein